MAEHNSIDNCANIIIYLIQFILYNFEITNKLYVQKNNIYIL